MDGPCSDMDGSLAALFIEPKLPSMHHSDDESSDELKHMLARATMDLESARAQYECEVQHLKRLLRTAVQERDEAREEAMKLKESFLSSTTAATNTADAHILQNSSMASSSPTALHLDCLSSSIFFDSCPSKTQFSDLHWDIGVVDLPDLQHPPPPLQSTAARHSHDLEQLQQLVDVDRAAAIFPNNAKATNELLLDRDFIQHRHGQHPHFDHEFNVSTVGTSVLQSQLLALDSSLRAPSFSQLHRMCSSRYYYQRKEEEVDVDDDNGVADLDPHGGQLLQLPSLFDSLQYNQLHRNTYKKGDMVAPPPPQESLHQDSTAALQIHTAGLSHETKVLELPMNLVQEAAENRQSAQSVWNEMKGQAPFLGRSANSAIPAKHLPEPPEADPEVMLRSLPERGKLLETVMRAGPLLQTLLVTGPLPQWNRPPPELSSATSLMQQKQKLQQGNQNVNVVHQPPLQECTAAASNVQIRHPMADICNDMSVLNGGRNLQNHHGSAAFAGKKPSSMQASYNGGSNTSAALLNTSANLSYSNCLLRNSSVLMPKRLVFSRPDMRSLAHP